jgi:hypothetical protein
MKITMSKAKYNIAEQKKNDNQDTGMSDNNTSGITTMFVQQNTHQHVDLTGVVDIRPTKYSL